MAAYNIIDGRDDGTFGGSASITRAQFATLVVKFANLGAGVDLPVVAHPFTDVAADNVHGPNIARLFGANIIRGKSDTTFAPSASISRAEAATVLKQAHEALGVDFSGFTPVNFTDVSGTHAENIGLLAAADVINGTSATTFAPNRNVTRAETASLLKNSADVLSALNLWTADPLPAAPGTTNQTFTVTSADLEILEQGEDRTYVVDVGAAEEVAVVIVNPDEISVDDGIVSFATANGEVADLDDTVAAAEAGYVVTTGEGAAEVNVDDPHEAFEPLGGIVTIEVSGNANRNARAIPVVFTPGDGNALEVDEDGIPEEAFGIGGEVIFTDLGALALNFDPEPISGARPFETEVSAVFTLGDDLGVVPLEGAEITLWVERNDNENWDGEIEADGTAGDDNNLVFVAFDEDDVIVAGEVLTTDADGEATFTWTGPEAPAPLAPDAEAPSIYDHLAAAFFSFGEFEDVNVDVKDTLEWSDAAPAVAAGDATFADVELLAIAGTQRVNTVTVVDQFDRPVEGATVVFTAANRTVEGDGTVAEVTANRTTNADGVAVWNRNFNVDAQETISAVVVAADDDRLDADVPVQTLDDQGEPAGAGETEYELTWYAVYDPADVEAEIANADLLDINTDGGYVIVEAVVGGTRFFGVVYTDADFFQVGSDFVSQADWVEDVLERLETPTASEISTTGFTNDEADNKINVSNAQEV